MCLRPTSPGREFKMLHVMFWGLHTWRLSLLMPLLSLGKQQSPLSCLGEHGPGLSSVPYGSNPPLHSLTLLCSFGGSAERADWDHRVWAAKKRSENEDQRLSLPHCTLQTFHSFISRWQQGMTLRQALSAKYPFMEVVIKTQRPLIGGAGMKPGCKSPECCLDMVDRCLGSVRFCSPK